jgi:hypothetical protein
MSNPYDMYHDAPSSRSPGSHRHHAQTIQPQSSRNFDAYGPLSASGLYTPEDHAAQGAYETAPRYNERMNAATMHAGYPQAPYDLGGAQGWNSANYGQNNALNPLLASRMKQAQRGRNPLPQVRTAEFGDCTHHMLTR